MNPYKTSFSDFILPASQEQFEFTPAFEKEELSHNKIWYTSIDNEIIDFEKLWSKNRKKEVVELLGEIYGHSGTNLVSNSYKDGKGVLVFDNFIEFIKEDLFAGIKQLESLYLPDSVASIDEGAFADCSELKYVRLPKELSLISSKAFSGCRNLSIISLPCTLTKIGEEAFYGCSHLRSITLPSGLNSIGDKAFCGCHNLSQINIPESVTTLGKKVFNYCHSLPIVDNIRYADSVAVMAMEKNSVDTYTLKEDTRFISDGAFEDCELLESIHLPEGVVEIAESAFENCELLESIHLPEGVVKIAESAFADCSKLAEINIPESVAEIGKGAFKNCRHITTITIPEGVTTIGACTFVECSHLRSVHLPESLTKIGDCAFASCSTLAEINIPANVSVVGAEAFSGCSSLPIDNNVMYADTYALSVVDRLVTSCALREGTRFVASGLFEGCINLKDVTLPNTLTSIGLWEFGGCSSLPEDNNVIYAGDCAVRISDNTQKTYILRENTRLIGDFAFGGCENLTSITLPQSVVWIGRDAFINCENLKEINIPDGVTHIGDSAFGGCKELTNLSIPNGVKELPWGVFGGCLFQKISLPSDIKIDKGAFFGCDDLWEVTLRNSDGTQEEMFVWDFVRQYQLQGIDTSAKEKHWFDLEFNRWDSEQD